jgi:hypothetical protein
MGEKMNLIDRYKIWLSYRYVKKLLKDLDEYELFYLMVDKTNNWENLR